MRSAGRHRGDLSHRYFASKHAWKQDIGGTILYCCYYTTVESDIASMRQGHPSSYLHEGGSSMCIDGSKLTSQPVYRLRYHATAFYYWKSLGLVAPLKTTASCSISQPYVRCFSAVSSHSLARLQRPDDSCHTLLSDEL